MGQVVDEALLEVHTRVESRVFFPALGELPCDLVLLLNESPPRCVLSLETGARLDALVADLHFFPAEIDDAVFQLLDPVDAFAQLAGCHRHPLPCLGLVLRE